MNENFGTDYEVIFLNLIISYEFDDTTIQVKHFLRIIIKSGLGSLGRGSIEIGFQTLMTGIISLFL